MPEKNNGLKKGSFKRVISKDTKDTSMWVQNDELKNAD